MPLFTVYLVVGDEEPSEKINQVRKKVGTIEAKSLNEAWMKTQNNWNSSNPCRSTRKGDVFESNGKFYMLTSLYFIEIDKP
jgi:hypothetical protein